MNIMPSPVFIISGVPGSGKTSVSQALLQKFPLGVHLPLDTLREFVVSGRASVYSWNEETTRQFSLARRSVATLTACYAEAGFAVAIDDVAFPGKDESFYAEVLGDLKLHKVLLKSDLETILRRNAARTTKTFDTSELEDTIKALKKRFDEEEGAFVKSGWLLLESSALTLEQTILSILQHCRSA